MHSGAQHQASFRVTSISSLVPGGSTLPWMTPAMAAAAVPGPRSASAPATNAADAAPYPPTAASGAFTKVLRQAVAAVCAGNGFDAVQPSVLELLSHLASAYILEMCDLSRTLTEAAGRTNTVQADIWVALASMGHDVESLPDFLALQHGRSVVIPPPKIQPSTATPTPLHVGRKRTHHPHIHDFFPPFPDPHTYVRTEITVEPEQSYERARELQASRRRSAETSLCELLLRTHDATCLFPEAEQKGREEARQMIASHARRVAARREARVAARQAAAANKAPQAAAAATAAAPPPLEDLPEDVLMADESPVKVEPGESVSGAKPATTPENEMEDDGDEDDFELVDTEASLIRRRIPQHCFVLEPNVESRPYLSALQATDDEAAVSEDPAAAVASMFLGSKAADATRALLARRGGASASEAANGNGAAETSASSESAQPTEEDIDDRILENPFLRSPKMPMSD